MGFQKETCCHVNRRLVSIKLYYFLRYVGAVPLQLFLPLLALQRGVSPEGVGFLWTFLPIIGVLSGTVLSTLADYLKAHRAFFLASLVMVTLGLSGMYWAPHILTAEVMSKLYKRSTDSFPSETHFSEDSLDILPLNSIPRNDSSERIRNLLKISEEPALDSGMVTPLWHNETIHESFRARNTSSSQENAWEELPVSAVSLQEQLRLPLFWVIFLFLSLFFVGLSTSIIFADTTCYMILGKAERNRFGQQRLWGTVGWGLSALVTGALVDLYSAHLQIRDYFPAFILVVVFMSLDLVVVGRMPMPQRKDEVLKAGEVKGVICSPSTILFLVTILVLGMSVGFLWTFHLMLVEEVALAWDPGFRGLKLLQGLLVTVQSFFGEVPFFFVAGYILDSLGTSRVLILVLMANAVRYIAYYFIRNPWLFLPFETLNGVSYGLFYAAVTARASEIAPPGAQATLQGIVRATQFTGNSLAGAVGGALWSRAGSQGTFLIIGLVNALYYVFYVFCRFLIQRYSRQETIKDMGKSGYMHPSKSEAPQLV